MSYSDKTRSDSHCSPNGWEHCLTGAGERNIILSNVFLLFLYLSNNRSLARLYLFFHCFETCDHISGLIQISHKIRVASRIF